MEDEQPTDGWGNSEGSFLIEKTRKKSNQILIGKALPRM